MLYHVLVYWMTFNLTKQLLPPQTSIKTSIALTPLTMYTTNQEDQEEAAKLQKRLASEQLPSNDAAGVNEVQHVPSVSIDEGAHKYVLIQARAGKGAKLQHFVVSKRGAHYHRNAAEPMVDSLQRSGYTDIKILGGGRIRLNSKAKEVDIFGFSYSFGQGDHSISQRTIQDDPRYKGFKISTSNDGY